MYGANSFVAGGGILGGDLNTSYEGMIPHHTAIYWRFLYEQCGGMKDGVEDPGAGMQVIRNTLKALYSRDIVDIHSSTDLVAKVPEIIDRALEGSSCPFKTHEESLIAFARAIYALRLHGGRCTELGGPAGCGFYDPYGLYYDPPLGTINYSGADLQYSDGIRSSFGMDFIDVILDPAAEGQPVTIELHGAPGAGAEFNVQIWKLSDDTTAYDRLGLVITRIDARESWDPIGEYTILFHSHAELKAGTLNQSWSRPSSCSNSRRNWRV